MKKVFAIVLAVALTLTSVAALAATSTIGGETVTLKDGKLVTYGEVTFQEVDLATTEYKGVKLEMPAKEAAPKLVASLKKLVEDKKVASYVIEGIDEEGELTGEPLDIVYNGKAAKLIVVIITVTDADGKVTIERWNFVKLEGEDDYKVVACYVEAA